MNKTVSHDSVDKVEPGGINPERTREIVQEIKTQTQTLPQPVVTDETAVGVVEWVNARIHQYSEILQQYGEKIETVYLQVHPNDLRKAAEGVYPYSIEIEPWEDIKQGTYRIEYYTTNPVIDNEVGLMFGAYGEKTETEITWALWRKDAMEVETAQKIAPKLV